MAILSAHTLPTLFNPKWDHTYIESDDGLKWGCFGRDTGGNKICSANGESAFADCLSYPRGKVSGFPQYAGITYAIDGVCHQAANRILYAAGNGGLDVAAAKGYPLSLILYGAYGLGAKVPWPRLSHCANIRASAGSAPSGGPIVTANKSKSAQLADNIRQIYSQAGPTTDDSTIARQELEALARVQLGEDYDPKKIAAVAEFQRSWRESQQRLTERLKRGDVSPEGYRAILRQLIAETASHCEAILGDHDFERLFGVPAKDAADLLAPPSF